MPLTEERKQQIEAEERESSRLQERQISHSNKSTVKHGLPALFSFFIPGLGQIIKGQVGKGILIFVGMIFSWLLLLTVVGAIVPVILWVWQIYDAYNN